MTPRPLVVGAGALVLHGAAAGVLVATAAGSVPFPAAGVALLAAVAVVAAVAADRGLGSATPLAVHLALVWFVLGLVHHYAVGIDPEWGGDPVSGLGHVAWDAAFHAPAVLLAATVLGRLGGGLLAGGR